MYRTLDRKDICLAYEEVKIVPWQTTLLWGRKAVIVVKLTVYFVDWLEEFILAYNFVWRLKKTSKTN